MHIIEEIQDTIKNIYKTENITVLSGMDMEFKLPNGKQVLVWNSEVISNVYKYQRNKGIDLNSTNFQFQKNLDNLLFNSDEIAYFTANAFLYKDLISNPIDDAQTYYDDARREWITYYPNFVNLASKRYSMFIAVAFEKIYNYWDRLGDLLWATYFQNDLKEVAVDFNRIIDCIKNKYSEYHHLLSYQWLLNFKENQYKALNEIRKNIVHYTSIDIEFKWAHLGQFENNEGESQNILSDKSEIEKVMTERKGYSNILKEHISLSIEGFIQIHQLIEDITVIKLAEAI
ncbi:hypothetical protein AMR72_16160 [Flavobacterium psychrophilum]|nr:hypothetical protein AMR72_16160 [Flavobacterium psychrophilum]AOE53901.1 hypothetical protein ALW18_16150 [Flavobacterium psychrophilum]